MITLYPTQCSKYEDGEFQNPHIIVIQSMLVYVELNRNFVMLSWTILVFSFDI